MSAAWDPKKEPFRVVWEKANASADRGWSTDVQTFATLGEAVAAATAPFGRGVRECYITEDSGPHRRIVGERKRKQSLRMRAPRR